MKTLTKILSVTALIVLCVCLFTLTAFAADKTVSYIGQAKASTCCELGNVAYVVCGSDFYKVSDPGAYQVGKTYDDAVYTELADANKTSEGGTKLASYDRGRHTNLQKIPAVADSCVAMGHDDLWFCSGCGNYYTSEPSAWAGTGGVTTMPVHSGTPAHTPGGIVKGNGATCTHEGNLPYAVCTKCGAIIKAVSDTALTSPLEFYTSMADTKIPQSGHAWGGWTVIKPQTNVSPGQEKRECANCDAVEYREIPADGITEAPWDDLWYVVPLHDTWLRGEEALTFDSNLVEKLNRESGPNANYVGVRVGTDSLYENSYDTFDFWSWDRYIKLGDKTMQGLREGQYRIWVYDRRNPKEYTTSCDFWVVDVPTLEPYSTDKHVVNSSKSLRFIASEEIRPDSIMVGSRRLYDSNDYFVSNDRKNVTLSPDFLNARQTGTYTISALTKDGRTIKTNFYILSTAQASSSPRTGDESQIGLWAAFLLLSGAAIVVMVPKLRKHGAK